ncbi:autism susceptibility gene 2 protein-like protein [Lates japonicus]|uniref:Autism susceptibility gene 2 protein-like protein n=1 Tax=Lates japonicus TaxID=270547 RepID=A0AAD3MFG0_LATJO|nr:autism susceptibility gene 2 protein-like protein [Lates japonicus]
MQKLREDETAGGGGRLHLREELDETRLHQLHQSPMEGHLPHAPCPTSGAPPTLCPARCQASLTQEDYPLTTTWDPRDYSHPSNPKEVEAG